MKVALAVDEPRLPRTVYYEALRAALLRSPRAVADAAAADVIVPAEDTAQETNWPRFGRPESALVRGVRWDPGDLDAYLARVLAFGKPACVVNMNPWCRYARELAGREPAVALADVSLTTWERAANPRTISMPASSVTRAPPARPSPRTVLASFRGAASHPCRDALARLHDGRNVVVELVRRAYSGRVDATTGAVDDPYVRLLASSVFAFVPRGDAHFSYRLTEVMAFGCIPIVVSDDWVLPFDRTIDWRRCALVVSEARVPDLPTMLAGFGAGRIAAMQHAVREVHDAHFADLDRVVATLLDEVALALAQPALGAPAADVAAIVERYAARSAPPPRGTPLGRVARKVVRRLGRVADRLDRLDRVDRLDRE